ncbi:hypothetical protein ACFWUW_19485 [Streptomyces sp. NPDC058655]|uniref:hypothetical protein n=1 Tax=Streptomyces sp. NPDC058655 TaxID=3346577 RepID=UPI003666523F
MTERTTARRARPPAGPPKDDLAPAATRAERRRLIESIRAHRRLLAQRRSFETADRRRLNREARERGRAERRHGRALQRAQERRIRKERSLSRGLKALDGEREHRERVALAVLRRESIQRALRQTRLTPGQVNGIGSGLVGALSAQGVRTAADFERVSWGKAPNGRGGDVLHIHRSQGPKVHINGIGEHRGRPLMEWRRAALARAEAGAPRELPPQERRRVGDIIESERNRLRSEAAEVPRTAEAECAEAEEILTESLARLAATARDSARGAALRRAEFDAMAERLLALQAELAAHIERYGGGGLRARRAQSRALGAVRPPAPAPLPKAAPVPAPRTPESAASRKSASAPEPRPTGPTGMDAPRPAGARASLGWLVPIVFFGMTAVMGVGEVDASAPSWFRLATRCTALAMAAELVRLWVPRRRWRTAGPMPPGSGPLAAGAFLALTAASMLADPAHSTSGAPWAVAVASAVLLSSAAARRRRKPVPGPAPG